MWNHFFKEQYSIFPEVWCIYTLLYLYGDTDETCIYKDSPDYKRA